MLNDASDLPAGEIVELMPWPKPWFGRDQEREREREEGDEIEKEKIRGASFPLCYHPPHW